MAITLPFGIRVAAGLVGSVVDRVGTLPQQVPALAVTLAGQALRTSMRVQQELAALATRGDDLLAPVTGHAQESPPWATFDDDEADPVHSPHTVRDAQTADQPNGVQPDVVEALPAAIDTVSPVAALPPRSRGRKRVPADAVVDPGSMDASGSAGAAIFVGSSGSAPEVAAGYAISTNGVVAVGVPIPDPDLTVNAAAGAATGSIEDAATGSIEDAVTVTPTEWIEDAAMGAATGSIEDAVAVAATESAVESAASDAPASDPSASAALSQPVAGGRRSPGRPRRSGTSIGSNHQLTIAELKERLQGLDENSVRTLLAQEETGPNRAAYLTLLGNRLMTLQHENR